ncbi:hypothetical protein V8C34DRAFT_126263 [Trichoderma compactum]
MEFIFGCAFLKLVLVGLGSIQVKSYQYPVRVPATLCAEPAMGKGGPSHTLVSLADSKNEPRGSTAYFVRCLSGLTTQP